MSPGVTSRTDQHRALWARLPLLLLGVGLCLAASWYLKEHQLVRGCWYWLAGGLSVVLACVFLQRPQAQTAVSKIEIACVVALIVVGAAARFYKVTTLPGGIWSDESEIALDAVEILDGSNPTLIGIGRIEVPRPYAGMVAVLFKLAGISVFTIKLPGLVFSVVGLLTTYLLARALFGVWPAVLVLGLLAGARWPLNMSRWGHGEAWLIPSVTVVPWLALRFMRNGRMRTAALAGAFLALSQYPYSSCRLSLPVTGALIAVLCLRDRSLISTRWKQVLVMGGVALVLYAPIAIVYVLHPDVYVRRAREVSLLSNLNGQPALPAIWESAKAYLLMYNVRGDPLGRHNFQWRPMVDWVTGGLALAGLPLLIVWCRRWEVQFLWLLALLTLATGVFTTGAPSTFRTLSQMVPYLMIAALPVNAASDMLVGRARVLRWLLGALVSVALAVAIRMNLYDYFVKQVVDPAHWWGFNPPATMVATETVKLSNTHDVYYSREIQWGNLSAFQVLLFGKKNHSVYQTLHLPLPYHPGRDVVYFDEKITEARGVAALYPGSVLEEVHNPWGEYLYSRVAIPSEALQDGHGLWLDSENSRSRVDRIEPPPPGDSHGRTWSGSLIVPQAARYRFQVDAPGAWWLELGGRRVDSGTINDATWVLPSGLFPFRLHVEPGPVASPITVSWAWGERALAPVPDDAWCRLDPGDTGLVAEDYGYISEAREPDAVRRAFSWETFNPTSRAEWRNIYSAKIIAPATGPYSFRISSDDGSQLYIDGKLLGGPWERGGDVVLDAGSWEAGTAHSLLLVYYQSGGGFHLHLFWKPPNTAEFTPIPNDALKLDWDYINRAPWLDPALRAQHLAPVIQ